MTAAGRPEAVTALPPPHDLVIIGAGPAGLSAFIQARRLAMHPIVVDPGEPGGALRAGWRVRNYPGIETCAGLDLARRMADHAKGLGGFRLLRDRAETIRRGETWSLCLASGGILRTRAVILATGQEPVVPESLETLRTTGALLLPGSYEGEVWRGLRVLIIGGGDVAFDQGLRLLDAGARPSILCRSDPRALPVLREEARRRGVPVRTGLSPIGSVGGPPPSVTFQDGEDPARTLTLPAEGVLVAAGRRPHPPGIVDEGGRPARINLRSGSNGGLFFAGDLRRGSRRQAVVAAGDGCMAALEAFDYLKGRSGGHHDVGAHGVARHAGSGTDLRPVRAGTASGTLD